MAQGNIGATDSMQFSIINGHTSNDILVAILTGNCDTFGLNKDLATHHFLAHHHHNLADLQANGYNEFDVVLDDLGDNISTSPYGQTSAVSVTKGGSTANVTMNAASGRSIFSMKESIRHNPRYVRRITISAVNSTSGNECPAAFQHNWVMGSFNGLQHEALKSTDMSIFFSTTQFQCGKIVADYAIGDLQFNDMTMWGIEVMRGVTMKVTVDFWPFGCEPQA